MTEPTRRADRQPKFFHQSAGAVVLDSDRCLVLRRSDRPEWVLPKGHIERDEEPSLAAIREVLEETGLEIETVGDLGSTRYRFGQGLRHRKRVEWFVGRVVGGDLRLEPFFAEAVFLPEEEAVATLSHEIDRELVNHAFALARRSEDAP